MERVKNHWWLRIVLLLFVSLCMMKVMRMTAAEVARLSGGQGIVDLSFGITPDRVRTALGRYNDDSVGFYRYIFLSVDLLYALVYGTFYRCTIRAFYTRTGISKRTLDILTALPLIGVTADLLENTVMFILLGQVQSSWHLCLLFTVFNSIKFVFVYMSLAIAFGGLIWLIKKHLS